MKNTLKVVLIIVGLICLGYGLYTLLTPQVSINAGPIKVEKQGDKTQSIALIGLGVLSLFGGLAFQKK